MVYTLIPAVIKSFSLKKKQEVVVSRMAERLIW